MDLKIKKDNKDYSTTPLLEEKLRGVELPYLHVKKGDKTWYIPVVKNINKSIEHFLKFSIKYKGEEYKLLQIYENIDDIKVITLVNGEIHNTSISLSVNIFFNKAKRLILYGWVRDEETKLINVNYNDVLVIVYFLSDIKCTIYNLTTGETVKTYVLRKDLEFREE